MIHQIQAWFSIDRCRSSFNIEKRALFCGPLVPGHGSDDLCIVMNIWRYIQWLKEDWKKPPSKWLLTIPVWSMCMHTITIDLKEAATELQKDWATQVYRTIINRGFDYRSSLMIDTILKRYWMSRQDVKEPLAFKTLCVLRRPHIKTQNMQINA